MRNLYKPNRFKVASIQAQQTLGGDVMQADEEGDYVEFRDYRRALDEIEMMKHTVKYWEIEAQTDHARWLRVMEDYERLKDKSNCQAECLNAFDVKLSQAEAENASLKKDVDRLRDRYAEATQENARLKAEVERLRKAGDAVSLCLEAFWKGKPYDTSTNIECFDAWNAAKEGKQS